MSHSDDPFAALLDELSADTSTVGSKRLGDEMWDEDDWSVMLSGDNDAPFAMYAGRPLAFAHEVLGVTELSSDQVEMIESVRDNTVTVAMSATAVGKTFLLAVLALYFYKCYRDVEIYAAAAPPSDNLRILLWGEISRFVNRRPELFTDDKMTDLKITRRAKQHIRGLTIPSTGTDEDREAKFSGKHQRVLIFIFDEGDAIPDPCYRGADGCMSGGEIVRQIICFNPKKQTGEVYRRVRNHTARVIQMSALNHPNVVSGENRIKGAVTRNVTCKRIHEWCSLVPYDESAEFSGDNLAVDVFKLPDYLVGYEPIADDGRKYPPLEAGYYKINDSQFSYKVLGRFPPAAENALFPLHLIEAAVERYQALYHEYGGQFPDYYLRRQGVDVAEKGSDETAMIYRDGFIAHGIKKVQSMDSDEVADLAAERHVKDKCSVTFVDGIGVGSGISGRMSRLGAMMGNGGISSVSVKVSERSMRRNVDHGTFGRLRDELYWSFRMWLMSDKAAIPNDDRLIYAMSIVTYEVSPHIVVMDKKVMRNILGFSPDVMEALLVTFADRRVSMSQI